jgi:hypothetical protein
MVHRSFDVDAVVDHAAEGPTFDLGGQTFHCLAQCPAGVLNRMLDAMQTDVRGNRTYNAPDLIAFVTGVLIDKRWVLVPDDDPEQDSTWQPELADDVDRFLDVVDSKDTIIPIERLGDVVVWLTEQYVGRPTS